MTNKTKAKHTPGPWEAYYQSWCHTQQVKRMGNYAAHVDITSKNHEEDLANATLIAAAPDLLDACLNIAATAQVNACNKSAGQHRTAIFDAKDLEAVIAAIRKARGSNVKA